METYVYRIGEEGITKIQEMDLPKMAEDKSAAYLVDIHSHDRQIVGQELKILGLHEEICNNISNPADHIQFEYFGESLYGELSYFSPKSKKSGYLGIITHKNILFGFHSDSEGLLKRLIKPDKNFTESQKNKISAQFLLYIIILEILSRYGKLILSYREKIEVLALDLDTNNKTISPNDFLEAKSQLSVFSRVIERLYFTLSFPPTKDVLADNSLYDSYFEYLLRNMGLIKISLKQTEERLDSLNDHYHLLLQAKGNKRLNFLTIIQAVFVPLTLVAGIYGMNFEYMPELSFHYGYFISLGGMSLIALVFIYYFYKKGWFK